MRFWLLALVLAASMASALSTTTEFNATLKTVEQLVAVDASLDFPILLPGAEYAKNVTVRWALPDTALRDLSAEWVRVHVVAYAPEPSWILLSHDGTSYRVYSFVLQCRVVRGKCAGGSKLEHVFQTVLRVPPNASSGHSERLVVQASLSEDYPSIVLNTNDASFSQRVQDFFDNLPLQQAAQALSGLVQPAGPSNAPTSAPSGLPSPNAGSIAVPVTVNGVQIDGSSASASNDASLSGLPAQLAAQPSALPPGKQNVSPISGLIVTRDDAVFYGATVVLILLSILFAKRFFLQQQRSNGLLDA